MGAAVAVVNERGVLAAPLYYGVVFAHRFETRCRMTLAARILRDML
jgi:hypothetical protein